MNETEFMLTKVRGCRRIDLYDNPQPLSFEQENCLRVMKERRQQGEPLQYILGEVDFFGLTFKVDQRVLIPRPETELLVEEVLQAATRFPKGNLRILDIGTGSGNIAVTLAKNLPLAKIVSLDISSAALELARENAGYHGVDQQISFLEGDALNLAEGVGGGGWGVERFDMVVSNPPYVPTQQISQLAVEVQREPWLALDGGDEGLKFYDAVIKWGIKILNTDGRIFFEIGDGQRSAIEDIFARSARYADVRFVKDYVGTDRIVTARFAGDRRES